MTATVALIVLALVAEAAGDDLLRRAQDARLAGDFAAARRIIDDAPGRRTPEELFDAAFSSVREAEQAELSADDGRRRAALVDAARRLDAVLQVAPAFDEARNNRALVNFALGEEEQAYDDLTTAIRDSPDELLYRRNLGDLYARGGQAGKAASAYAALLREVPYDSATLDSLLALRLERSADGAEELLELSRGSGGPLASAGPRNVLREADARRLHDDALLDLTRDFAERLPVEPLETFRAEVATLPENRAAERDELRRLMSDRPLGGRYEWWRERPERRASIVALLQGRASRALADGHEKLAAALAKEAAQWAGEGDLAAARKAIEFAMAAGDVELPSETAERGTSSANFEEEEPPVYFDTTKSDLREDEKNRLRKLAERAKREGLELNIVGHTDSRYDSSSNLDLSKRRADAVRDFLIKEGVPAGQIEVDGRGEREPRRPNIFERGRQKNRRADIRIGR